MSYSGTMGGAVPISTGGNRATSGYDTTLKEGWRMKSKTKLHLVHFIYGVNDNYMNYSCWRLFRRKAAAAAVLLLLAHGPGKENLEPAQNVKSESNLTECIHAGVMLLSME